MLHWLILKTLKALRGFLDLKGYNRKFVKNYGLIATLLTSLLKKDAFHWIDATTTTFYNLKQAIITPLVLSLPDFTKGLEIECDASGSSIGAVSMQCGKHIAFLNQVLKGRNELFTLVMVVKKWRSYFLGSSLIIRTNYYSLKYLFEQKVDTLSQQEWISKLLIYEFTIEFNSRLDTPIKWLMLYPYVVLKMSPLYLQLFLFPHLFGYSSLCRPAQKTLWHKIFLQHSNKILLHLPYFL